MRYYTQRITILIIFLILISPKLIAPAASEQLSGEKLFTEKGCIACHTIGNGKLAGPDLLGVTERREIEWLKKWLKSPDTMVMTDPIAKEMLKEYFVPMPNQGLNDEEIELLIDYFKTKDKDNKN